MTMRRSGLNSMRAPMRCRNNASSRTSGSVAAPRMTDLPSARAADKQGRLGGAHARVGQLDDGAPQAGSSGPRSLVGHLHLGAQGPQGVDVEVNRPASQLIAADSGHEGLAGEVQERAEQQHRDAVEPAEG